MTTYAEREGWTFNKRLLFRNKDKAPCGGCGKVHRFHTVGCKYIVHPDQWEGDPGMDNLVSAPLYMNISKLPHMGDYEEPKGGDK